MAFTSTKGSGNIWNPTKDAEDEPRTEATPEDFIDGYFVDQRDGIGQNNATMYTLQKKDGERVDIWGTTALNGEMSKIRRGQYIRIQWLGKKPTKSGALIPEKKRKSTDSFHAWDVFIDNDVPVLSSGMVKETTPAATPAPSASRTQVAAQEEDLPF